MSPPIWSLTCCPWGTMSPCGPWGPMSLLGYIRVITTAVGTVRCYKLEVHTLIYCTLRNS